jgi:hypothetical protein
VSDRALQDRVLRALADAPFRASPEWRQAGLADPDRVERFARFLARHFYYERVVHFFKYSRALAPVTGRHPDAVLRHPAFDAILPSLVLGDRDSARAVAALVVTHVEDGTSSAVPYLRDLVRYEEAMMVVEAGPRVWRDEAPPARSAEVLDLPATVEGTMVLDLQHDLPAVLPPLLRPWTEVPTAPARRTQLVVARTPHGRVTVARGSDAIAKVIALADGRRTRAQLAADAGLSSPEVTEALQGLGDLGAIRFSTGS